MHPDNQTEMEIQVKEILDFQSEVCKLTSLISFNDTEVDLIVSYSAIEDTFCSEMYLNGEKHIVKFSVGKFIYIVIDGVNTLVDPIEFCEYYGIQFADKAFFGEITQDNVVLEVMKKLNERSKLGTAKYGTTLENNPLSLKQWLQHSLEECLDMANYLQAAINSLP